jgi:predicted RNA-binding Zn ribbon-like protein
MNTYTNASVSLPEALINTFDTFLEQPEHLQTPADLHAFLEKHHIPLAKLPTEAELSAVRELRETLRTIWNAETLTEATERLNLLLTAIHATPQVTQEEENTITLTFQANPQTPLLERLTLAATLDIVTLLQCHGHPRLRHCAAAPCRDVFVDTSRNRTRRFCSDRCANRYNVAAFRERRTANH